MSIPAAWLIHAISVEPYLGISGTGNDLYGPAVTLRCLVEEKIRHVRGTNSSSSTGDELLSSATAYVGQLDATAPAQSRVTLPSGRVTYVLEALRRDGGNLPVPTHLELVLS